MKKQTIILMLMLLLTFTSVLAFTNIGSVYNRHESVQKRLEFKEQAKNREEIKELVQTTLENMESSQIREKFQSEVKGLQNAYCHVNSTEAKERIQQNMERFQNKFQYNYDRFDATEVNGETVIMAKRNIRFLIFNFNVEDTYKINNNGEIIMEQRGVLSRLFIREGSIKE